MATLTKHLVSALLFLFLCFGLAANNEAPAEERVPDTYIAAKLFLGASALINSTDPGFSAGFGFRGHLYLPGQWYGFFIDAEWNKRGGSWGTEDNNLHYLDLACGGLLGRRFYFGGGFLLGVNLAKGADVSSHLIGIDLASLLTIGYIFPEGGNRFILGFDFKISLIDLYGGAYIYARKNITWGGTLGWRL